MSEPVVLEIDKPTSIEAMLGGVIPESLILKIKFEASPHQILIEAKDVFLRVKNLAIFTEFKRDQLVSRGYSAPKWWGEVVLYPDVFIATTDGYQRVEANRAHPENANIVILKGFDIATFT